MHADKFFAEKFGSRTKAKESLEKGYVLRAGKPLSPKDEVCEGETFTFLSPQFFLSNGGYKLERGLSVFGESAEGLVFADLGASTGGFTDCLLQRGAKRVYCVDVGESLLHPSIAADDRVRVMDRTNARYLNEESFPEPIDCVVSDLSFISLRLVLGAVYRILPQAGKAFVLFKPQFECGGAGLGKSGILPQRYHAALLRDFYAFCVNMDLAPCNIVNAPLREKKNIEYIIYLKKGGVPIPEWEFISKVSTVY